jgi:thiamine biosynthesis lipoprotein
MGTTWHVRVDNRPMVALDTVRAAIEGVFDRVSAQMSDWAPDSDITRFNNAPPGSRHALDTEFAEVLACALRWAASSGGAFDPTVGPLVSLWGFGPQANSLARLPAPADIAAARARLGWQRLRLDGAARVIMQPGGVRLDLSGIAKGFAVDRVATVLQAIGLSDFVVEIGGELRASGLRPGGNPWQVAIEAGPRMLGMALTNMAVATSSNRRQAREHGGRRWSHTIDPRTGAPVSHSLVSVTVLHPQCKQADALATALMALGPEDGAAFAERHKIAALFVKAEGDEYMLRSSTRWAGQAPAV